MKRAKLQLTPAEKDLRKLRAKIRWKHGKIQHLTGEIHKCRVVMRQAGTRADELIIIRNNHQDDVEQLEKKIEWERMHNQAGAK